MCQVSACRENANTSSIVTAFVQVKIMYSVVHQPPIPWVTCSYPGVKRLRREVDQALPFGAELRMSGIIYLLPFLAFMACIGKFLPAYIFLFP
jgi:hypothetical protein